MDCSSSERHLSWGRSTTRAAHFDEIKEANLELRNAVELVITCWKNAVPFAMQLPAHYDIFGSQGPVRQVLQALTRLPAVHVLGGRHLVAMDYGLEHEDT